MPTLNREQVVANFQSFAGNDNLDLTHTTLQVTKTATMSHGTLLLATGLEAVAADLAANIAFVIDDPKVDLAATGDVLTVSVVDNLPAVKFFAASLKLGATALSAGELTTFAQNYA